MAQENPTEFDPKESVELRKDQESIIQHELDQDRNYKDMKSLIESLKKKRFRADEVFRTTERVNSFISTQKDKRFDRAEALVRALQENERRWASLSKHGVKSANDHEQLFKRLRGDVVLLVIEAMKEVDVLLDYETALVMLVNLLAKSGSKKVADDFKQALDELVQHLADLEEISGFSVEDRLRQAKLKRKAQYNIQEVADAPES